MRSSVIRYDVTLFVTLTKTDPKLSKVLQYTRQGWPSTVSDELKPYKQRAAEITTEGDCLLWGI